MRYALPVFIFNRVPRIAYAMAAAVLLLGPWSGAGQAANPIRILALGDSLTAGYGLPSGEGFADQLEARLKARGFPVRVFNAGVSGDTSAGGLARLDWALADRPDIAIVELGANDGLRGIEPEAMRSNLDAILRRLRDAGVRVLLTGMRAPPNLGRTYEDAFNRVFPELARKHGVAFYPFFLDGVAADPAFNQPDGIHPNRRGVAEIVDRIAPYVVRLLAALKEE
jgi:acyl-CoA thioesterase-1